MCYQLRDFLYTSTAGRATGSFDHAPTELYIDLGTVSSRSLLEATDAQKELTRFTHKDSPSPLGVFGKLPSEIRVLFWQQFLPEKSMICTPERAMLDSPFYQNTGTHDLRKPPLGKRLGLLRTSRKVYEEVSHEFYVERTFCWCINPRRHDDNDFVIRGLPLLREPSFELMNVNFSKFKRLKLEIYPPVMHPLDDFDNQVETIQECAWSVENDLRKYKKKCPDQTLPELEIVIYNDVAEVPWYENEERVKETFDRAYSTRMGELMSLYKNSSVANVIKYQQLEGSEDVMLSAT